MSSETEDRINKIRNSIFSATTIISNFQARSFGGSTHLDKASNDLEDAIVEFEKFVNQVELEKTLHDVTRNLD